ncbi:hypothetical protein [Varunaivibrio sulfuroxidans]|uniref:Uncharacterized protein n=1 Tax=Varunaivibrio sulfuroxidans TaxID=1773489 RepID=A0A4R3J7K1_9PROT|nr:hypothetical protein [Varunaivibrio sulfuroxidans]TCS61335.1 hypothetical protein EDD55_108135 [Varunaivibrio sulfuroxidans]WES31052.1 hypothetical protein P3M64_01345 [Varunaivibrio sulfuroxidans]
MSRKKNIIDNRLAGKPDDVDASDNPTPRERGRLIVKRLEKFIREGRGDDGGMSFSRWQELALHEVVNAIRDAERHWRLDQRFVDRAFSVGASALVTAGVWGTALAIDRAPDRQVAGVILIGAGAALALIIAIWGARKAEKYYQRARRRDSLQRIDRFDRQIKELQRHLDERVDQLKSALEEMSASEARDIRRGRQERLDKTLDDLIDKG